MTIQWELTIQVLSGLCQHWQGDAKCLFLMELQIHNRCKKACLGGKKSSQQYSEFFRPVRQPEWKDRLLLQKGYTVTQCRLNYLSVSVSVCLPAPLSLTLFLIDSQLYFCWHTPEILNYYYTTSRNSHMQVTLSILWHTHSVFKVLLKTKLGKILIWTCWKQVRFRNAHLYTYLSGTHAGSCACSSDLEIFL